MEGKTCCVTGHRDIPAERTTFVEQALRREVLAAVDEGYTRFLSGFAQGADLIFAAIVAEQKVRYPWLSLEAYIPYGGRLKSRDRRFQQLLQACDEVRVECETYTPSCFMQRNRRMARQSQRVIAVYDGREGGGTLFTMRYAHALGREVRVIQI